MVIIEAIHTCMVVRGVKESEARMVTSAIRVRDDVRYAFNSLKEEAIKLMFDRR